MVGYPPKKKKRGKETHRDPYGIYEMFKLVLTEKLNKLSALAETPLKWLTLLKLLWTICLTKSKANNHLWWFIIVQAPKIYIHITKTTRKMIYWGNLLKCGWVNKHQNHCHWIYMVQSAQSLQLIIPILQSKVQTVNWTNVLTRSISSD